MAKKHSSEYYEMHPAPEPSLAVVDPWLRLGLAVCRQAVRDLLRTDSPLVFLESLAYLDKVAPAWLAAAGIQVDDRESILIQVRRVYA